MNKRYYIIGNWKMNKTASEAVQMVEELMQSIGDYRNINVVICVPFTALASIAPIIEANNHCNLALGAQNVYPESKGAFTGEISVPMLRDLFVSYIIIGHSERRQLFGEKDDFINKKVLATVNGNLKPILCVGETLEEREAGKTLDVIQHQLKSGLKGLKSDQMDRVLIAYEPVWAIGTGKNATPSMAQEVHAVIRKLLKEKFDEGVAAKVPLLYGGSMKPDNAQDLLSEPDIDGGLIGGASLEKISFLKIIKTAKALTAPQEVDA